MAQVDSSLNNPNDPNNPNNAPGALAPAGENVSQPSTTASGAGPVTATGSGNVAGQVVGTKNPAQPFQNISSYLKANEPQSQQLAGQVADTVSKPITDAQTGITNAADQFSQSVNKGYTAENKDLTSAVAKNPNAVAQDQSSVDQFLAQLNDHYAGPTDFTQGTDYADLQGKIAQAQGQAANTQNEAGIQTLLGSVEGPTTAGINKLDSLLLSANPNNYKTIQDAGKPAETLLPTLQSTAQAQNQLAAQGATSASSSAAAAAKALQDALTTTRGSLSDQQKTVEDIVNNYNKSVGVVTPVTQSIAQSIKDFLAANPQLSISDATSALAPLTNLKSIDMPDISTFASPEDYQTVQALAKLGLNPADLGTLPINGSQANLAQSFQLPKALQDALGKAPDVQKALSEELNSLGGQINSAVSPFVSGQEQANQGRETYRSIVGDINIYRAVLPDVLTDPATGQKVPKTLKQQTGTAKGGAPIYSDAPNPAYQALQQKAFQAQQTAESGDSQMANVAPGLQWVNNAVPGYNELIQQINAQLGKLGDIGAPTLTYGKAISAPAVGSAAPAIPGKDVGNAAAVGIGAGVPAATGAGLLSAGIPTTAAELAGVGGNAVAGQVPAAGLTGAQVAGPAALAAYGTSNIVQNSIKNPITSGLATLGNTGLSLATLSLPPQVFQSIGNQIKSVFDSIGNFFGGLF